MKMRNESIVFLISAIGLCLIIGPVLFGLTRASLNRIYQHNKLPALKKIVSAMDAIILVLTGRPEPRGFSAEPLHSLAVLLFFVAVTLALVLAIICFV